MKLICDNYFQYATKFVTNVTNFYFDIHNFLNTYFWLKLDMFSFENMHHILFEFPFQQAVPTCIPHKG